MKYIIKEYQETDSLVDVIMLTDKELRLLKVCLHDSTLDDILVDKIDQLLLRDHTTDARRWEDDGGKCIN